MDSLLEKGMMLLWSNGYNATSVNDIVKAAEIPKGSFYFYFDSKEDFAVKAIEAYFEQMIAPIVEILGNTSVSPKQRILNLYEYRTQVLKDELDCKMGCLACNVGNEMAEHSEKIRNAINEKEQRVQQYITDVVLEAQEYGEIDSSLPASELVAFMEDAGKGAMISMKAKQNSEPIDNFVAIIRSTILK
ncbi:MAG: TetR/AcrR family transcriptional regulator [Bacteroidota bacterium]